jgi:lipid-A-disaccharide synthase
MVPGARPSSILVSAGEPSGDRYAAGLVLALKKRWPEASFFGCAGPELRRAGVDSVVDAASLAVVGLAEVVTHIPRIWREFRKLERAAAQRRPDLAILTDSPDFHLRLAARLRAHNIPILYLVAPQVWAWRKGRIRTIRRNVNRLACIFPFEEEFFRNQGVPADYIGHPLAWLLRAGGGQEGFLSRHGLSSNKPVVALLPGSRPGEVGRHLPVLGEAVRQMASKLDATFIMGLPPGLVERMGEAAFSARLGPAPIQVMEGETWDLLSASTLALAASGTVTVECAMLGVPMVTFYRVSPATWILGRPLVKVPFYTMVNLVAGRKIVPELVQKDCTGQRLSEEGLRLLTNSGEIERMKQGLAEVRRRLHPDADPFERAASIAQEILTRN